MRGKEKILDRESGTDRPRQARLRSDARVAHLSGLFWTVRRRLRLSSGQMCQKLGISTSRMTELERGHWIPTPDVVRRLAELGQFDPGAVGILVAAAVAEKSFRRGGRTIEHVHRRAIGRIEKLADLSSCPDSEPRG